METPCRCWAPLEAAVAAMSASLSYQGSRTPAYQLNLLKEGVAQGGHSPLLMWTLGTQWEATISNHCV